MTTNLEKHTTKNPIGQWALRNFTDNLIAVVKPLQPQSILDVGAGEGFTLARLKKEKIGKKLEGIEYMDEAIAMGKKLHPDILVKKGDIYKLPYEDKIFDLVICTEVLEHLENPQKGLKELIRVSKKYILVTVPNEPWFTLQRFLRGKNILRLGAHPEHIQWWTSKGFETFVLREKVSIIAKKYPFPWTMLLAQKFLFDKRERFILL